MVDFPDFCEMVRAQCPLREVTFDEIDSAFRSMAVGDRGLVRLEQAQRIVKERFQLGEATQEERTDIKGVNVEKNVPPRLESGVSKTGEQLIEREAQLNYLDEQEKLLLSAIMHENAGSEDAFRNTEASDALNGDEDNPYSDFAALLQPHGSKGSDISTGENVATVETVPRGIDFAEFCELVREQAPEKEITYEEIDNMFRRMDTNGDGTIDQEEFDKALADGTLFGTNTSSGKDKQTDEHANEPDSDSEMEPIDFAEFCKLIREQAPEKEMTYEEIQSIFRRMDTNGDGTIDQEEFDKALADGTFFGSGDNSNSAGKDGAEEKNMPKQAGTVAAEGNEEAKVEDLSDWMEKLKMEVLNKPVADADSNKDSSAEDTDEAGENTATTFFNPENKVSRVRGIMRQVFDRADTNRSGTLSHDEVCETAL